MKYPYPSKLQSQLDLTERLLILVLEVFFKVINILNALNVPTFVFLYNVNGSEVKFATLNGTIFFSDW